MRPKKESANCAPFNINGGAEVVTRASSALALAAATAPLVAGAVASSSSLSSTAAVSSHAMQIKSEPLEFLSSEEQRKQTHAANSKLCRLVRRNPCIYDKNHANHGKKDFLDKIWIKIANECNDTMQSCKDRWRNIRAAYARSINVYKTPGGPNRSKQYYLHKELKFLTKFLVNHNTKVEAETIESTNIVATGKTTAQDTEQTTDVNGNHNMIDMMQATDNQTLNGATTLMFDNQLRQTLKREFSQNTSTTTAAEAEEDAAAVPPKKPNNFLSVCNVDEADVKFLEALLPDLRAMNARQKIMFKGNVYKLIQHAFENCADFPKNSQPKNGTSCLPNDDLHNPQPMTVILPRMHINGGTELVQPILVKKEPMDNDGFPID